MVKWVHIIDTGNAASMCRKENFTPTCIKPKMKNFALTSGNVISYMQVRNHDFFTYFAMDINNFLNNKLYSLKKAFLCKY